MTTMPASGLASGAIHQDIAWFYVDRSSGMAVSVDRSYLRSLAASHPQPMH